MIKAFLLSIFCFITLTIYGQNKTDDQLRDSAFYNDVNKWFSAWKLISKDIYKIKKTKSVAFVFFDDKYVYSTSEVTITNGTDVKGPNLINLYLTWKKALHHNNITLPDGATVPVNLMSFAAQIPDGNDKSFFIMPLFSFWEKSGIKSEELGLENLVTGVFIHEFSHSQQMQNFGKQIAIYEQQNNFGIEFSDDLVQHIFVKDSNYIKYYNKEIQHFYNATKTNILDKYDVNEGLSIRNQRHKEFFKDQYKNLNQIDDFFLTMEGLGQYSMYVWLMHPKGANLERKILIEGIRRKGKWWSQDEGFALFLILDQLTKPKNWAADMFGNKVQSVIFLIDKELEKQKML